MAMRIVNFLATHANNFTVTSILHKSEKKFIYHAQSQKLYVSILCDHWKLVWIAWFIIVILRCYIFQIYERERIQWLKLSSDCLVVWLYFWREAMCMRDKSMRWTWHISNKWPLKRKNRAPSNQILCCYSLPWPNIFAFDLQHFFPTNNWFWSACDRYYVYVSVCHKHFEC